MFDRTIIVTEAPDGTLTVVSGHKSTREALAALRHLPAGDTYGVLNWSARQVSVTPPEPSTRNKVTVGQSYGHRPRRAAAPKSA